MCLEFKLPKQVASKIIYPLHMKWYVDYGLYIYIYMNTWNCRVKFKPTLLEHRMQCYIMKGEFVLWGHRIHWMQQRCWAPAVFLIMSYPLLGWVVGQSEAPQTQFLQLSFLSAGQPPDRLYTLFQTVHASHVWTWPQAEPWEGRYLPQCTVAKRHAQSRSSSCCSTMQNERQH